MSTPIRSKDDPGRLLHRLLAQALVAQVGGAAPKGVRVSSLTDDSRRIKPGALYVAIRGGDHDGHDFVESAVSQGASVVIVDREVPVPANAVLIRVADARVVLSRLAASWYEVDSHSVGVPRLIGITGTNGKTTVAWLLRSILRSAGRTPALFGTIEYDLVSRCITAPLTTPGPLDLCRHLAAARDAGATDAVLEVSSHALDQRRCDGLEFSAAVFTNLSGDHLDYHGDMHAYGAAKVRLFDGLTSDGKAIINADDEFTASLRESLGNRGISFGLNEPDVDVHADVLSAGRRGSEILLRGLSYETKLRLSLVGRHNVSNALAAAATAESLGISCDAICAGLETVHGVPGRLQRAEPAGWPFSVLVDYAHTDGALKNVLDSLRPLVKERLICVFGCGGDRDRSKRPRMAAEAGRVADVVYVTSDNPRREHPDRIISDVIAGFDRMRSCAVRVEPDRRRAIETAIAEARPGDTVLIAGKGHETYQLVDGRVLDFDDVAVARSFLKASTVVEEVA